MNIPIEESDLSRSEIETIKNGVSILIERGVKPLENGSYIVYLPGGRCYEILPQ